MKQTKRWAALALATVLLAACSGQPETKAAPAQPAATVEVIAPMPAQSAAPTEAPKADVIAAAEPAVAGAGKTVAKPVFIDFYAPW